MKATKAPGFIPPPWDLMPAQAITAAVIRVIRVSVAGAARARALAPRIRKAWRRFTTSATRASSKASRFSILTTRTPSRLSITAVDRAEVSAMAPWAARDERLA